MSTPAIEELLSAAERVQVTRNKRRIEVPEAVSAVQDEIAKQTRLDSDTQTVAGALAAVTTAAIALKAGDDIQPLKDLFQALFEAEGVRLIDVGVLNQAIEVRLKETSEADIANADEDGAIADLAAKAAAYQKEE